MGVEFINLSKAYGTKFDLRLRVDGAEEQYLVSITEIEGVFALECTAEIQRLFLQHPPKECQALIAAIKQHYQLLTASPELQAA